MSELSTTSTSEVKTFQFGLLGEVRAVVDDAGNPWFVGADLASLLEYRDSYNALRSVRDKNKGTRLVSTPSGQQGCLCVNEPGLYQLVMKSQSVRAEPFQDWVTDEVIPQIRKTGAYSVELSPARQLLASAQHMVDIEDRQIALAKEMEKARVEAEATREEVEVHAAAIVNHGARLDSIEQHTGFVTILAWCRQRGIPVDNREASRMGKAASTAYRQRTGLEPKKTGNEKYGYVNMYPEILLGELFA